MDSRGVAASTNDSVEKIDDDDSNNNISSKEYRERCPNIAETIKCVSS